MKYGKVSEEKKHISTVTGDMRLMWGKGPGKMAAITSTVNVQVDTETLDPFLILSVKKKFGEAEVIFQDDDTSQLNDTAHKQSKSQSDWKFRVEIK